MKESVAITVMRPFSLDGGRVDFGGTGAGRLYFQVSDSEQFWMDSGGSLSNWTVTGIGELEPLATWTHHGQNRITVE
jgi:hypothetical protein